MLFAAICVTILYVVAVADAGANDTGRRQNGLGIAARGASGVYLNVTKSLKMGLKHTIVVANGNWGFIDMLHNLKCFTDRLGLKVLVMSLDHKTHKHIYSQLNTGTPRTYFSYFWQSGEGQVTEHLSEFHRGQFHMITMTKLEGLVALLRLGYDVLYTDTDIAIVRDPFPYLIWNNIDYVYSVNQPCPQCLEWDFWETKEQGNTGFHFARNTEAMIRILDDAISRSRSNQYSDDQDLFWNTLRSRDLFANRGIKIKPLKTCYDYNVQNLGGVLNNQSHELVVCPLDGCLFSAGGLRMKVEHLVAGFDGLRESLNARNETPVALHANYIVMGHSAKRLRMSERGLWLYDESTSKCAHFPKKTVCTSFPRLCA